MNAHWRQDWLGGDPPQARKKRVLFVINSLAGGGAERVMATLLANSAEWRSRYEIALAVLDDAPASFDLPDWLTVLQLDCRGGLLSSIAAIDRAIGRFGADITISFLTRANLASGLAMTKRRRPWIISERTSTPAHLGSVPRQFATKAMMRLIYPLASRVIAVSAGVATKLERGAGVKRAKIDVLPNPVDAARLAAAARGTDELAETAPYIMAVGRLVSVKNYGLLIRAFAQAQLPCKLVIAGDGPERQALTDLVDRLGVRDRVVMPGWLSNPYPALERAKVFALSSNIEGFPNALVEALAFGVPAVATNCQDGPAEILLGRSPDEVAGLTVAEAGVLTPVGDVDRFADALRIAFDPAQRASMSEAGRTRAADYSASAITARYWDVIERVLERTAA